MFKKILCAAVALTMCLCAAGCTDIDTSSSQADSSSAAQTTVTTAAPESSSKAETTTSDTSSQPEPKDESDITPAMWKVTGKDGNTVYFLGSMHALDDSCYPLPDEILDAYNSSDSLAVECDIYAYQEDIDAQMELVQGMLYTDGTTIADHIDADLYSSAKQILIDSTLYNPFYDYYNVIMWNSLMDIAMLSETNLDSAKGIDIQDYLENSEEREVEDESDIELSEELQAMIDEYNKQLLDDRNAGMIEKAKAMIDGGQNVFYVVGAAHFYGETGILKGLEDAGYTVEEIQYD